MELILNPSYTGDQRIRVTSLALEPLFIVQSVLNKFAWLTAAAACNMKLPNVTQRSKHLKRNAKPRRDVMCKEICALRQ